MEITLIIVGVLVYLLAGLAFMVFVSDADKIDAAVVISVLIWLFIAVITGVVLLIAMIRDSINLRRFAKEVEKNG